MKTNPRTAHTQGPWIATSPVRCTDGGIIKNKIETLNGLKIAGVNFDVFKNLGSKTAQANANLVAAAPEMLNALISLERWAKENIPDDWDDNGYHFIGQAKQALKKALGTKDSQ